MKRIISTVLLLTLLPTFAMADDVPCDNITDEAACNTTGGCGYNSLELECNSCDKGYYNPGSKTSNGCILCTNAPDGAEYTESEGLTTNNCPWELTCKADEYYDSNARECKKCSSHTNVQAKTSLQPYTITNDTTNFADGKITTRCECETYGQSLSSNGECTESQVECNTGYYLPKNSVTCKQCTPGSYCPEEKLYTFDSNKDQGLKPCPAGSTSAEGAISINKCYMDSTTKFYTADGTEIPFTTVFPGVTEIYYDNTQTSN